MILLYKPKLSYCDLDLEDSNPFLAHDTLAYNDVSPYWVIEMFNLGCDADL